MIDEENKREDEKGQLQKDEKDNCVSVVSGILLCRLSIVHNVISIISGDCQALRWVYVHHSLDPKL
jgi:hypothetical protein